MARKRHSSNRPTKQQFAQLFADELRRLGESASLEFDKATFSLVRSGPRLQVANLSTAYRDYINARPTEREEVLHRHLRLWLESNAIVPRDFADARTNLLPRVRSRRYGTLVDLESRLRGMPVQSDPGYELAEHLTVQLVYDRPDSTVTIHAGHLSGWGVTFDDAFPVALQNLRHRSREDLKPHSPGVWRSPSADDHDAARLLLTEIINRLPVRGEPVAAIPNRNTLLITGSQDIDGLRSLAQLTKREFEEPDPITAISFRLSDGIWTPFLPPPDHPHYEPFRELWLSTEAFDYGCQSLLLLRLNLELGDRAQLCPYVPGTCWRTGRRRSVSRWPLGQELLVPRTEAIWFVRINDRRDATQFLVEVAWDRARDVLGDRLVPTEYYPPLFRVRGGVSEQDVTALQEESSTGGPGSP